MKELTFPESNNDYAVGIYPNKKMFEVRNENNGSFLFDQEGNLLYESDKSISVVDNVVYEEESSVHHEDIETWISTGTVYDLKGQSIGRVENMVGVLFNDNHIHNR